VGNLALVALKLGVGWISGSRALLADGWHSLSDVATNGGAWLAHRFSHRAPDADHHYGHGKAEAFSGLVVGLILLGGGVFVSVSSWSSTARLDPGWKGWLALSVAGISILTNIWLAVVSQRAARETQSQGLAALARDNASDALGSVLVILGILGSRGGLAWAEPTAAIGISGLILWMGWRSVVDGSHVLMDRSDPELRHALRTSALRVGEVRGVQSVRVHPLGAGFTVDMEISVDGSLTVAEGHRIAHDVETAVTTAHAHVMGVHVHVNAHEPPAEGPGVPIP
jgi:cation diffusion facilitator family transporter